MLTSRTNILLAIVVVTVGAGSCFGQRTKPRPTSAVQTQMSIEDQRAAIEKVVNQAKKATTVDELTQVLKEAGKVYQLALSKDHKLYLLKLTSWLYTSRGEKHADQAASSAERGELDTADELEDRALRDFSLAIKAAPTWRAHHNRGVSYAMLNEFEKALNDFNIAIQRNEKEFGSSFFNRGEIYFELGEYEKAEQDYEKAYQLEPQDIDALVGRANARFYGGKAELALIDFDKIVFHKSNDAVAYADRGDVHAYLQNWEKAAQDFKIAINLDKSIGRAYQSAAWLMATCPDEKIRNPQLAVKVAKKAIELDGDKDYRYLDTLAAAQASVKEFEAARDTISRAIAQAPDEQKRELQQRMAIYQAGRSYTDQLR